MANEENLKVIQSESEAREKGKKGGIASGKARRRKKMLKDTVNMLLALPVKDGNLDKLTDLQSINEKNITVEEAMILKQIQRALKGDLKAFESVIGLSENHSEPTKPENKESDNAFVNALNGKTDVWEDENKE